MLHSRSWAFYFILSCLLDSIPAKMSRPVFRYGDNIFSSVHRVKRQMMPSTNVSPIVCVPEEIPFLVDLDITTDNETGAILDVKTSGNVSLEEATNGKEKIFVQSQLQSLLPNSQKLLSCKDRCEQGIYLPCSCSKECEIFNSCCEDIDVYCPNVRDNGRKVYQSLLTATRKCDWQSGVHMIDSCPTYTPRDRSDQLSHQSSVWKIPQIILNAINARSTSALNHAIANTPVTDTRSYFTYANYTFFECGALPGAKPVFWLPSLIINTNKMELDLLEKFRNITDVWYFPPNDLSEEKIGYPCISKAIHTCHPLANESIQNLCQSSPKGYVSNVALEAMGQIHCYKIYKNKYCARCSVGADIQTYPWIKRLNEYDNAGRYDVSLRIAFTLSESHFVLKIDHDTRRSPVSDNSWNKATCDIKNNYSLCKVTQCNKFYTILGEENCLLEHNSSVVSVLVEKAEVEILELLKEYFATIAKCFLNYLGYLTTEVRSIKFETLDDGYVAIAVNMLTYFKEARGSIVYVTHEREIDTQSHRDLALLTGIFNAIIDAFTQCSAEPLEDMQTNRSTEETLILPLHNPFVGVDEVIEKFVLEDEELRLRQNNSAKQVRMPCRKLFDPSEPWLDKNKLDNFVYIKVPKVEMTSCFCSFPSHKHEHYCALYCFKFPPFYDDAEKIATVLGDTCSPLPSMSNNGSKSSFKYNGSHAQEIVIFLAATWLLVELFTKTGFRMKPKVRPYRSNKKRKFSLSCFN